MNPITPLFKPCNNCGGTMIVPQRSDTEGPKQVCNHCGRMTEAGLWNVLNGKGAEVNEETNDKAWT